MKRYLARISLTPQAVKDLHKDKATGRRATVTKLVESVGGRIEAFYFSLAVDEVVGLAEFPGDNAATAIAIAVNGGGYAQIQITPLLPAEEVDAALAKAAGSRPPGQ